MLEIQEYSGNIFLKTNISEIDAEGLLGRIHISSSTGEITLCESEGEIIVDNSTGEVTIDASQGVFIISTSTATIIAEDVQLSQGSFFRTSTGNININVLNKISRLALKSLTSTGTMKFEKKGDPVLTAKGEAELD
ncbi:MAG: hypothetical protein ACLFR1_09210 [Spirochaetia bacterium]